MANRLTDKTVAHPGPLRPQGRRGRAGGPRSKRPAPATVCEVSGTGPQSGPAGATAPARRKARKPSERSERPALEGKY